ncbi:MAG: hypothetical protein IT434_17680 [Phycisphaerales bacterium]|nr:hypothetical protein [Phycisphaerales bacterium]
MKNYLKAVFCVFLLLLSCKGDKGEPVEKSYALFCWPSKTPCDNLEYGIEFSYKTLVISPDSPNIVYRRTATLVCCRYIEALVDSLAAFNDSLINQFKRIHYEKCITPLLFVRDNHLLVLQW